MLINQGKGGDFIINENGVMRLRDRVCVPNVPELKKSILEECHMNGISIHLGATNMYQNLRKLFWWPYMNKEVVEFVYACLTSQKSKSEHQKSSGLMQPLSFPKWKWDIFSMGFVTSLSKTTKGCGSIWVIVDRLTKSTNFILIKINYTLQKLVELYIEKIVSLHGILSSIVSDRDLRSTSSFWKSFQEAMGTKMKLSSTAYHPQTDGQA